jgi:hypothetical protein
MEQFSNIDAPKKPQKVHIRWELITPTDDTIESPEDKDEGFWPSQDPDSPGYIGDVPEADFAAAMAEAQDRKDRFDAGDWEYVGVVAVAHLMIPIGCGGSFRLMTMQSGGLWGVESDCTDYIAELFEEQKADLLGELKTLGEALTSGDFIQEGEGVA